ncbi:MAG: hypothetical protein AAF497_04720, partial [Planctomycetota bacterium]
RQISRLVTSLRDKGLVTVQVRDGYQRTIRAAGAFARVSDAEASMRFAEIRATIAKIGDERKFSSGSDRG